MQQIGDWLQKLGVGQYAQSFAENDIDLAVLADLTDQDLEKIGVLSLGHLGQLKTGSFMGCPKRGRGKTTPGADHATHR